MSKDARTDQRIPTGVPGFDEVLLGGLVPRHNYLIVGEVASGKTIFSLQWLLDGRRNNERGLYISLIEPVDSVKRNVSSFGWRLDGIDTTDLTLVGQAAEPNVGEYHIFPPSDVEFAPVWQGIYQAIEQSRPQRVVIDSVTQLRYLSTDEYQFRKHIQALMGFLYQNGCTSFHLFESSELDREVSIALAVDGIIRLHREMSPARLTDLRSIRVDKFRGSDFKSGLHSMRIAADGIRVYPHRIEVTEGTSQTREMLSSGNGALDALLGGGLESGTTTVITGPTGGGKSALGMQFLEHSVTLDRRGILYAFEESAESIVARSRGIGMSVTQLLKTGALKIVPVNPLELYPDEFLSLVRTGVEQDGCRIVMIDSLQGYQTAMEEFGTMAANIRNLTTYLNRHGVTTLLVNEVEHITGDIVATEHALSYVVDNIILLRYAEYSSGIIKVIGCLKKRLGGHQTELRQLQITPGGIQVSEPLAHLRGILTGAPSLMMDDITPALPVH